MYERKRARHMRRKTNIPLYAFVMAVLSFVMAFACPPERQARDKTWTAPAVSLSALADPAQPRVSRGVEPEMPSQPAAGEDWMLTLVNPWNPLPEGYTFQLKQLSNGHSVDERCYPDLQAMMDACRAAGLFPVICSSYRSMETQERLFQNKVDRIMAQGRSQEAARAEAAKTVAVPGTSEHQLGLALDIVDLSNQRLDTSQEDTAVQKWLMEHSWEYGFILRYPSDKSEITGIIYEPWHYRYVGRETAKAVFDAGLCLEEYLGQAA